MPERRRRSPTVGPDVAPGRVPPPLLRGRLHTIAAALSVGALVWLVRSATSPKATVAAWIYGVAAVGCYVTSASYHVLARSDHARTLLQRADHAMIYVLIGGTFTPVCLLAMHGWWRWIVLGMVWAGVCVGIVVSVVPGTRLPRFGIGLYLVLGWAGVAAVPALARDPIRLTLVVAAGVLYTVGAILFARKRPTLHPRWFGYHEFWHGIGVAAGALLFVVNLGLIAARTS